MFIIGQLCTLAIIITFIETNYTLQLVKYYLLYTDVKIKNYANFACSAFNEPTFRFYQIA